MNESSRDEKTIETNQIRNNLDRDKQGKNKLGEKKDIKERKKERKKERNLLII